MRYLLLVFIFVGCASPFAAPKKYDWGLRVSTGLVNGEQKGTLRIPRTVGPDRYVSNTVDGEGTSSRAELFKRYKGHEFGAYYAIGDMDYANTDYKDIGLSHRYFFLHENRNHRKDKLRPYTEFHAAFRTMTQDHIIAGFPDVLDSGNGFTFGLGIGAEYKLSDRFGIFTQVGLDFGGANIGSDFVGQTTEWGVMIGGVTRF